MEIEEQSSFRAGRTSIDKIFYITQMIEKTKAPNRKLYLIFIYLTKTYDSVQLNKTWETLDKSNVNTRFMEAIKSLHKGSSSKIKIGNLITKGLKVTKRLRQVCSLSPALFKMYIEQVLRDWKRKCLPMNTTIQNKYIFILTQFCR